MISLGSSDGRKGLGLGFGGGGREMEDTELEEGEACSYNNNNDDYDASIDPDVALSYIDEKLQDVLGHFQKDFEGGVSAENLGAKFGGYGSFLPAYQRSPVWSRPKSPPKVQSYNAPRSPNNMPFEVNRRNSVGLSSAPQSVRPVPASVSAEAQPAVKALSNHDSAKQEMYLGSTHADELSSRHEIAVKKSAHLPDQKTLKVRLKVCPDNLSTRKNAAIYSGLGLDVSPSSSFEDSHSDSEGTYRDTEDASFESPTSILRVMTSFPVHGDLLLSPLSDDLLNLTEKEKVKKENRHDSGKRDGILFGEKRAKSVERNDFSAEWKSATNRDVWNDDVVSKREVDVDALACEELVSRTLRLPLISNSCPATVKSKGTVREKVVHDVEKEEPLEPVSTQENSWENSKGGSAGNVWEDRRTSLLDDSSGYTRKDGHIKGEKNYDSLKGDSNALKGRKALNIEPVDPLKQKVSQKATLHEQDSVKLTPGKEYVSKRKSKVSQSHGGLVAEVPKESSRIGSSSMPKQKKTSNADNYMTKRDSDDLKSEKPFRKAEDRYREFFGDLGESEQEENQTSSLDHSEGRLKETEKFERSTPGINYTSKGRPSGKKTDESLASEMHPKSATDGAPHSSTMNVSEVADATAAPVLIEENWVCCDKCLKWRLLPVGTNPDNLPEKWLCSMLTWLPGMNRCSISEEETTRALIALYQVPAAESQNNAQNNHGNILSRVPPANIQHPDPNFQSFNAHSMPVGGKKKPGFKEISSVANKDGSAQLSNSIKKIMPASARIAGSVNDGNQSPLVGELGFQPLSKSCDLPVEKNKHKQKLEKHKAREHNSDGGNAKSSKVKGKRLADEDSFRTSKKIKADNSHFNDEDWMSDHAGAIDKVGPGSSSGLPTTSVGKDKPKPDEHSSYKDSKSGKKDRLQVSAKRPKEKVQGSLDDIGSLDLGNFDGGDVSKKRKDKECHDAPVYMSSLQGMGNQLQDTRVFEREEFSENDYRKEKKARIFKSKSDGKDSSVSKSSGKLDKKGSHTKSHRKGQDIGSTMSQRSLDGIDSLKRDFGPAQPSAAATSSSSKVSGSHKSKRGFHETKGSPVESVSSSPMRIANPDKLPSARKNFTGKDESYDAARLTTGSPRRCSDGEDNGESDRSGTVRKEKTSAAQHGSHESSVVGFQEKDFNHSSGGQARMPIGPSPDTRKGQFTNGDVDYFSQETQYPSKSKMDQHHVEERKNDNHSNANGSRPRKSGKGSSRSKDKNRNFKSDPINELQGRAPSSEGKPRDGRNKFPEKFGAKPSETENRYVDKKEPGGKLSGESSKRENQSNFGGHEVRDGKIDATCSQDTMSTLKHGFNQDSNSERYTKKLHAKKTDQVEIVPGRENSQSLPPSGGVHNGRPVSGSQKGNGIDTLGDASQGDDALKVPKQIKRADHQNGAHNISSRHPTVGGHRNRDVTIPSPLRKDSSSQTATNALKEAKDVKHLADRLKNSGSNVESTQLYFQAALKFLHGASLLESGSGESAKHGEIIQSMQVYSSTAKLCEFCAHEYERLKDMAAAALAYKCMEVAYMRVIYSSHTSASRYRNELQAALQMVPPGESPSSSASDVDNLNHQTTAEKVAFPKSVSSPQVAGNHIISARDRPNFVRLLNFTQDVTFAMEASRKSRNAFAAANAALGEPQSGDGISSVKTALDFNFQDVEGLLRLVRLAMEAISR